MGSLIGWIEALNRMPDVVGVAKLRTAMIGNPAVLRVLSLYLLAFAWLVYRWTTRRRRRRRTSSHGLPRARGLLRSLSAVAFLALGILLALGVLLAVTAACGPLHLPLGRPFLI